MKNSKKRQFAKLGTPVFYENFLHGDSARTPIIFLWEEKKEPLTPEKKVCGV